MVISSCWYNVSNGKYINTAAKAALNIDSDCTITARFASKTAALFETGGQPFDDLGDAVSYAQANSQSKITLLLMAPSAVPIPFRLELHF